MTAAQQAIRTFLAVVIGFFLQQYFLWPQGCWLVMIAVLLIQLQRPGLFWQNEFFVLTVGLLIAGNVYIANTLAEQYFLLPIYLFVTTFVSVYAGLIDSEYLLATFFINVSGAISAGVGVIGHDADQRVGCVLLGAVIALIIPAVCWPISSKKSLRYLAAQELLAINKLQKYIIAIYMKRDYTDKHYYYEKNLHYLRWQVFGVMQKMRGLLPNLPNAQRTQWQALSKRIEHIVEIVIAMGDLRYRLKDHTTFEVGEIEFTNVSNNLSLLLTAIAKALMSKKSSEINFANFLSDIQAFEAIYQATLQVVTKEPIVFLIFMQNLYALNDELNFLNAGISRL